MRKRIVAGNWKMNNTFEEAEILISGIVKNIVKNKKPENVEIVICPPFPYLEMTGDLVQDYDSFYEEEHQGSTGGGLTKSDTPLVNIGAQNVSGFEQGAYTGEISAKMLKSLFVDYCIIGHSERRKYFHETDKELAAKVNMAVQQMIYPIFCCGEVIEERKAERHFDVVKSQLKNGLFHLEEPEIIQTVIAYEPVWAIGTGLTATPAQAQEMHAFIRGLLVAQYGDEIAAMIPILYGGSCNAVNAAELFANPDVDGGLIGGASLSAKDFMTIARSF